MGQTGTTPSANTEAEISLVIDGWPEGAPRDVYYQSWALDVDEPEAIEKFARFTIERFQEQRGFTPEFVFRVGNILRLGPTEKSSA